VIPPPTDHGDVKPFKYPFPFAHKRIQEGGWARQVTIADLPISTTIAGVDMRLTAGGIRELHWHTAGEWALMLYGNARITCLDQQALSRMPDHELYIFQAEVPKTSLAEARRPAAGDGSLSPQNFSFRMMDMQPTHRTKAGEVRIVDSKVFQASNAIAAAHVIVHPEDCAN
jgi:oxalate decarboxylase/phosphoglucose isomerase-like protein (cupin superfamily)